LVKSGRVAFTDSRLQVPRSFVKSITRRWLRGQLTDENGGKWQLGVAEYKTRRGYQDTAAYTISEQ
jgi:hypothetical protein